MHTHRLKLPTHEAFLHEERHDPVTGDAFREGDEVVFCASCRSAFLKSSWEYMGGAHCGQRETLETFPKAQHIDVFDTAELPAFSNVRDEILYSNLVLRRNEGNVIGMLSTTHYTDFVLSKNELRLESIKGFLGLLGLSTLFYLAFISSLDVKDFYFIFPHLAFFSSFPIFKAINEYYNHKTLLPKLSSFVALGEHYVHELERKTPYSHLKHLKVTVEKLQDKIVVNFEIRTPRKTLYLEKIFKDKTPIDLFNNLLSISQYTKVYFWSSMQGDRLIFQKFQDQYEGDLHFLEN